MDVDLLHRNQRELKAAITRIEQDIRINQVEAGSVVVFSSLKLRPLLSVCCI